MYADLSAAEMVLRLLLEGNSVSSVERLTNVHHGTILKLLVIAGNKCERIMATKIRNVKVRDVEADEVWSFIGKKQKRARPEEDQNLGDPYTSVAIEHHFKLVLNIAMGKRSQPTTDIFIEGLRSATSRDRFQITTDGFGPYGSAIENTSDDSCDFAQLIKVYRAPKEGEKRICTSIVERPNLSLSVGIRRFTRLTNASSKKWENHWAGVACWFAFYNFCRVHKSLRVTPAMAAGIANHVWSVRELLEAA